MSQNRREFLRLLASGVIGSIAGAELDVDRLLWVPGRKTIFLPTPPTNSTLSLAQIVAAEWERVLPRIQNLFERDDIFYRNLYEKNVYREFE